VKKQLALPDHTEVCGESKFSELGADSLDTVNHNGCVWFEDWSDPSFSHSSYFYLV
jgi:hypothetical protein